MSDHVSETAERLIRDHYGRLVALLSRRCRDIGLVEDALSTALAQALERWSTAGLPENPPAWMLTVARRRLVDLQRQRASEARTLLAYAVENSLADTLNEIPLVDQRLEMMFVCAHPAIDAAARAPLMLQVLFGFSHTQIAQVFLVAPNTMMQRLSRAKLRIRDLNISFEIPARDGLPERLETILDAIYAIFGAGWDDRERLGPSGDGLAEEAIRLGELLLELLPGEAEAEGLLALLLFCHARRFARRDQSGKFIPLDQQDPCTWEQSAIARAEWLLTRAATRQQPGRYQWEAAVQSAHVFRLRTGQQNWSEIAALYDALLKCQFSLGAALGWLAARSQLEPIEQILTELDALPINRLKTYQPYWALKADLLASAGQHVAARSALQTALGLTVDPAVREYLRQKLDDLSNPQE